MIPRLTVNENIDKIILTRKSGNKSYTAYNNLFCRSPLRRSLYVMLKYVQAVFYTS